MREKHQINVKIAQKRAQNHQKYAQNHLISSQMRGPSLEPQQESKELGKIITYSFSVI